MKKWFVLICCGCLLSLFSAEAQNWQSALVKVKKSGKLVYAKDKDGFVFPDFSHAGYRGGGVALPVVKVVKEISPVDGDNTSHIQQAIDEVAALNPDSDGIRGALLLKAGVYPVAGTLMVNANGIVLRGEGAESTIIRGIGDQPHQRDIIVVGNRRLDSWGSKKNTENYDITSKIVPVGATTFEVKETSRFKKGDAIVIYHPCTEKWLEAIRYGDTGKDAGWTPGEQPIEYQRYITEISGNKITVDAPVFYSLDRSLSQSYIYGFDASSLCRNCGVEDLCVEISSKGGQDENHASNCIRFYGAEDCWALRVTTKGFILSGIMTHLCTRSTIKDCAALDPVGIVTGGRYYNFNIFERSQLVLFEGCYAKDGRHNYISNGNSTASGCVFLHCVSEATKAVNEGHRRWTTGVLFDNLKEVKPIRPLILALYNRGDYGTGHGWAMAHGVLWNCDVTPKGQFCVQQPPTGQNYSIGGIAATAYGKHRFKHPAGYIEGLNRPGLQPASLYEAQLKARLRQK